MARLLIYLLVVSSTLRQGPAELTESEAEDVVREWGGKVRRDGDVASKPVVELDLVDRPVGDKHLAILKAFPHLKRLFLGGSRVTDKGLKTIAQLKNLEALGLNNLSISDAGLKDLRPLGERLIALNIDNTNVTDAGIRELSSFQVLTGLSLRHNRAVGDAAAKSLARLGKIEVLDLRRTEITDKGLREFRALSGLRRIYLSDTPVTDEGIERLKKDLPKVLIER